MHLPDMTPYFQFPQLILSRVSAPGTHRRQPETPNVWVRGTTATQSLDAVCGAFRLDWLLELPLHFAVDRQRSKKPLRAASQSQAGMAGASDRRAKLTRVNDSRRFRGITFKG
jgi:hypothetical protein